MQIMLMIFPFVSLLLTMFFFSLGGIVLVRRKPFVMSSRWLFSVMMLAFTPQMIYPFIRLIDRLTQYTATSENMWFLFLSPLMFLILLIFSWIQMQGYMFLGVTDETVRAALHYGLHELKTPYEEILTKISIPDHDTELYVAVQSWMGTGQIRIKDRSKRTFLTQLVLQMRFYYEEHDVPIKKITAIFYLLIGGFMSIFTLAIFFSS